MSIFGGNLLWNVAKVANSALNSNKSIQDDIAIVYSVILDETHPEIVNGNATISDVGSVQCRLMSSIQNDDLILARPLDGNINILPIRNQTVFVQKVGSDYLYTQISKGISPNTTSTSDIISKFFPQEQKADDDSKSKKYSNVSSTSITRSNLGFETDFNGYGDYFQGESGIHKLRLYEGDTLFQGRFGQSIRLSGYNNPDNIFSPSIIIRNGESPENRERDDNVLVEEDINGDGNIIFLGGGDALLEWTLPTTVQPESCNIFYPTDGLRGNQILLNSDRIILSAKNAELIGVSKTGIGFITDGDFTIDANKDIDITTNGNIQIDTKGNSIVLGITTGKIYLGDDGVKEPAVKGNTLNRILRDVLVLIGQQVFLTASGPSSMGPTNSAKLNTLINELNSALSNNVYVK